MRTLLLAATFLLAPTVAQSDNAIGLAANGDVFRIDTATGVTTLLASGQLAKNCSAFGSDNRLWSVVRPNPLLPFYRLFVIDPVTGLGSTPPGLQAVSNLKALAGDLASTDLFGIRGSTTTDELVRIDTNTGAVTLLGATGFAGLTGLDNSPQRGLLAWDLTNGLVRLDPTTGAGTRLFPNAAVPVGMQFLTHDTVTGTIFTGNTTLRQVSLATGSTSQVCTFFGTPDLRGMEFTKTRAETFGAACLGSQGLVNIALVGNFAAGQPLVTTSTNHAPNSGGLVVIGFNDRTNAGVPLPILLDPLVGTSHCFLHVSADLTMFATTTSVGTMTLSLPTPAALGFLQLYVQHLVFEPVPGGVSLSSGLRVRGQL